MNLVLLDRQGFEFVVVPGYRSGTFARFFGTLDVRSVALAPSRAVAVRQLRYREDSLGIAFCPLLAGHRAEQAQIVAFDGEAATPWLEVANGAMPVQDQRGWLRPWQVTPIASMVWRVRTSVVPDLHSFSAVPFAVDHRSGVCQNPGGLRQRERTETHEEAVGKRPACPRVKTRTGTKVPDGDNFCRCRPPGLCGGGAKS